MAVRLLTPDTVIPDQPCERGGQIIFVPLKLLRQNGNKNTNIPMQKHNLWVLCNNRCLDDHTFQVNKMVLSFVSPERTLETKAGLNVVIWKRNENNTTNPTNPPTNDNILLNATLTYLHQDDHPEPCGQ